MRASSIFTGALVAAALFLSAAPPQAVAATTFSFTRITSDAALDVSAQLRMTVENTSDGALFTFFNNVGITSSITDIYFDDTFERFLTNLGIRDESDGVSFSRYANPDHLPGDNEWCRSGSRHGELGCYSADSDPPVVFNGVDGANEWISFLGVLAAGDSFEGLIRGLSSGEFNVGLRVQSIDGGHGDSYVSVAAVPLPAAFWLFGSVLLGVLGLSRRRVPVS